MLALLLTGCDIDLFTSPLETLKSFSLKWEISHDICLDPGVAHGLVFVDMKLWLNSDALHPC